MDISKLNIKKSILHISPYKPGESNEKAVKLSANENPLGCSLKVKESLANFSAFNLYPDGDATMLKAKINEMFPQFSSENIVCGSGSDEIIGLLISAFTKEGDEVISTEHGFLMYSIYAKSFGAVSIKAKEFDLSADIKNILAKVTAKTRIIFIANPNNPTGTYLTKTALEELRSKLRDDILLVIDGAYAEYISDISDYESGIDLAYKYDNVIATRTFSKIHGLASLRVGYGIMAKELADILNRIRGPFNLNQIAQEMAIIALDDKDFVKESIRHNEEQMRLLKTELTKLNIKHYKSYANFILIELNSEERADKLTTYLKDSNIYIRQVKAYNLPTKVRVSIGTKIENQLFINKLKQFLTEYD